MKIQYLSDLHLEFGDYRTPPPVTGDILVLAGDIHCGIKGIKYALALADDYKFVLYVNGNHEYYHNDFNALVDEQLALVKGTNVILLDNKVINIEGVNFIGATMWAYPSSEYTKKFATMMNDFHLIKNFSILMLEHTHKSEAADIKNVLRVLGGQTNVVITHHLPFEECIDEKYKGDNLSEYFCAFLNPKDFKNATHWIHGHTHQPVETTVEGIQIHCNPKGYPSAIDDAENGEFDAGRYIEV